VLKFRRNLSVPSSSVKRADCLTLENRTDRLCQIPEPSVRNYHCTLRVIPKECRFHLHRGESLKSRILLRTAPSDVPRADHREMLCLQVTRLRPFVLLRRVILTGWLGWRIIPTRRNSSTCRKPCPSAGLAVTNLKSRRR
jgi:hypothetical protein